MRWLWVMVALGACANSGSVPAPPPNMGPIPKAWYCVAFDGPPAHPGHYEPCYTVEDKCLVARGQAQAHESLNMGACERKPYAYCLLLYKDEPPTRLCNFTQQACSEERQKLMDRGHSVSECAQLPP